MKRTMLMLALLALAACGSQPAPPQDGPAPSAEPPLLIDLAGGATPSIYGLIGQRQRLGLTGAQVTRLDSLAIVLAAANDSLRRSVSQGPERERPRPGSARWQERTLPALETIARNNRAAGLLVQETLNEDQRRIACEMQAEQRERQPERGRRTPRGPVRPSVRDRMRADSVNEMWARGWPWCGRPVVPGQTR